MLTACLILGTTFSAPVFAQDDAPSGADIKRAAAAYDQGRARYRDGAFVEAAEQFEAADEAAPSAPALRLAIAARKEAGQTSRAATLAALALQRFPGEEPLAEEAQAVIDEYSAELARLNITCDSPCDLLLNSRLVHGAAAETRALYIEPGSASIRATWSDNRSQSESVDEVGAGEEREVSFYAPAIPEAPAEEPVTFTAAVTEEDPMVESESSGGWSPAVFWTGFGLTAAAGGATIALGVNALTNPGKDAVEEGCVGQGTECELYKKGVRNQTYATVAAGTTAAFGVFTLVTGIWFTDWGGKNKVAYTKGDLSVRPTFAVGDGALFGASGTF